MAFEELTFVQRGDVTVEIAFPSTPGGTTPDEYSDEICIDGDFNINDSLERETLDVEDWCRSQTPGQISASTDGNRTITADFTMQMVLSSETFQDFVKNYGTPNESIWIKVARVDQETNVTTWTETLRGRITQLNRNDRATGTSQVATQVEIHEITSAFTEE